MEIKVTKASGSVENFRPDKLRTSLLRSGADKDIIEEIIERVVREIGPYTDTRKIYGLARKYLRRYNHASGIRYSLKRALFRLGPTGYPFERYIGEVFRNYGYEVEVGVMVKGKCVNHEVDVLAIKDGEVSVIECKYHNTTGKATDVKAAMYVHSRFRDIRAAFASEYPGKAFSGRLVTNTRCTADAAHYAECSGLKVTSWRYPRDESLEKMIEDKLLYPVTVISGIKAGLMERLIERNIILVKDLSGMKTEEIQDMLSLTKNKAAALKKQAQDLCVRKGCHTS